MFSTEKRTVLLKGEGSTLELLNKINNGLSMEGPMKWNDGEVVFSNGGRRRVIVTTNLLGSHTGGGDACDKNIVSKKFQRTNGNRAKAVHWQGGFVEGGEGRKWRPFSPGSYNSRKGERKGWSASSHDSQNTLSINIDEFEHFLSGSRNEHDDRTAVAGGRRVSFKSGGGDIGGSKGNRKGRRNRQRGWDAKIRAHLQDEDIEMISVRNSKSHNYKNRKRSPGSHQKRLLNDSPSSWYKIIARYGKKYEKDVVFKLLANFIKPLPFLPYCFKLNRDDMTFIIEDRAAAEEIMNADRKITMPDGWKLAILVRPMNPYVEVDDKLSSVMKKAMSACYNGYTKSLSLAKFHSNQVLLEESVFCPLNRTNVMLAALAIIGEVVPDLQALDLSDNKLSSLEHMKILLDKAPHLRALIMSGNKLREIKQLDALKGLPIEELNLDGNSLCDKFTDKDVYIRAVRQRFPKVIKLDGVDLPPPILFGTEDEGTMPGSKASFMADPAGAAIVRQFLEQYYQLYDSEDPGTRSALAQAYHPDATFSMDAFHSSQESQGMGVYLAESRNLLRISSKESRERFLKIGQARVIETLIALPKTTHDPASFIVDLVLFLPQLIEFSVCGVFKEMAIGKKVLTRYFNRVFVIVPVGAGFCIINEQMTVLPATQEQAKRAFKITNPDNNMVGGVSGNQVTVVPVPPPVVGEGDLEAKRQLVTQVSAKTGMNLVWAEKCLVETNWNFEAAVFAFGELHKQGTIPEEAFIK